MVTWEMKSDLGTDKRRFIKMTSLSFFRFWLGPFGWYRYSLYHIDTYLYGLQSNSNAYIGPFEMTHFHWNYFEFQYNQKWYFYLNVLPNEIQRLIHLVLCPSFFRVENVWTVSVLTRLLEPTHKWWLIINRRGIFGEWHWWANEL